jgi:hypothetical protein
MKPESRENSTPSGSQTAAPLPRKVLKECAGVQLVATGTGRATIYSVTRENESWCFGLLFEAHGKYLREVAKAKGGSA